MSTEYASNDLCESGISNLPIVHVHAVLNEEGRLIHLPDLQNLNENVKHHPNANLTQLPALVGGDVILHPDLNNFNTCKKLAEDYITLPLEQEGKYSVSYVCRLCADVIDIDSAVGIFPTVEFQENLSTKINKYLPIVVYESDPFPKTVCKTCESKLNHFHELVEKSIAAEEQFRQMYEFDDRYVDELAKKLNQKSCSDLLKHESENPDSLYSISDFQYLENLSINHSSSGPSKHNVEEKKKTLNESELASKSVVSEGEKSIVPSTEGEKNVEGEMKVRTCEICHQGNLNDLNDCLKHSLGHARPDCNEYPCSLCERSFNQKTNWTVHVKTHFDETLSDPTTPNRLPNSKDPAKFLQQKLVKRKRKKFVCCRKCKESLGNAEIAEEHCLKHKPANVNSYPCVLCTRRVGKSKLKDHVALHYPASARSPVLSCDNCNNLYPDEKTLKYHRCSQLRKYKCSQCKLGFKSEDRLKFHEGFHRNKSTFCEICKKDFKFESRIYLHFAGVHNGIREKPYCCDVCGKTFTWLTVLNSHKRTHTNERPYKCGKCDARFCNKYSLSGHMPSHEDHPQFHCDKCDYHTGRKQNLQKHSSRFHREIDSSQVCVRCKVCNEIFPNRHHMTVEDHFSRHSREEIESLIEETGWEIPQELEIAKLYQCERCERCYMSADHLAEHRSRHSANDFFYLCRLCESGFSKHDLLVKHRKVHVNVSSLYTGKLSVLTVISCDICGIECVDYRQLLNHKDRGNCMVKKMTGTIRPKKVLIKKHLKPLKTHQLFINSNGLFECQSCQRTYKNRRRYRLHLATHATNSF